MRRLFLFGTILVCCGCMPKPQTPALNDDAATSAPAAVAADTELEVPSQPPEPPSVSGSLLPNGAIALGSPDAPHTLLVITHPSCRYCKEFARHHLPRLIDAFVRDGSLRIDMLIRPLSKYPESSRLAAVAACAAQQNQGGRIHAALADHDPLDAAALKALESELRLDAKAIDACITAPETTQAIEAAASMADSLHANLVPAFVLDGVVSTGLPDYAELRARVQSVIDGR